MSQLERKTLKGSGGSVTADLTEHEVKRAKLAGADLFLGAVGRLDKDRILKYYCKNCNKEYDGPPEIKYERVDQEVAKGYTLSEQGEYLCRQCGGMIAQYKKFADPNGPQEDKPSGYAQDGFVAIRKLIGTSVYDTDASLIGTVKDIGLRDNRSRIVIVISTTGQGESEVPWERVMRIGDIVLIKAEERHVAGRCSKCGSVTQTDSRFCEQCGSKL
jgi:sporulation protein YlmC with PRC-barrel domain